MAMEITGRIGPARATRGGRNEPFAQGYYGESLVSDIMPRYFTPTAEDIVFTLSLTATTTGVAAGNIMGAAAAATTQFGLINPATSTKNLVLVQFQVGVISGTPGAGPLWHGYIPSVGTITAASPGGTIRSNKLGSATTSGAIPWASAAGAALTGGQTPITHKMSGFSSTATAQASTGELNTLEALDGFLIVPPGVAWLPLWSASGASLLNGYGVSWIEVPIS